MGDVNYRPLIEDMVWSFSRVEAYEDCPHKWYLKYIRKCPERDRFYSSYGSFMHKLIERYYNKEITKSQMVTIFLRDFKKEVRGFRPKASTLEKFINGAVEYLTNFEPFSYQMIAVEKKVEFTVNGRQFVGYIDFLGKDADGNLVIIDNKSRDLKQRSGRPNPTLRDKELDKILRQLYIYAIAVEEEYGKLPTKLCINCFRTGVFIEEDFNMEAFEEAKAWVENTIQKIMDDGDFEPNPNVFSCFWICGVNDNCEYDKSSWEKRRRDK